MNTERPNILIFMTDQQQAAVTAEDHPCRTPNLDRFARDGVRFSHCYTTMTHCCPSRASFMTGMYPSQHGVYNNVSNPAAIHRGLNDGVVTFAERLKGAGYSLHFSGKWHISSLENPSDRGWEELEVSADKDAYMGIPIEDWRQFQPQPADRERPHGVIKREGWGDFTLYSTAEGSIEDQHDHTVVSKAVDRIGQLSSQTEPWCMYVGTFGPHDPFIIPEPYASMYDPVEIELPPNYRDSLEDKPGVYRRMSKVWGQMSEQEVRESIAYYWGYCAMVDDWFGSVLQALKESGQEDNTLVLFLSDHGESLGAHGLYLKGISAFEETYRIPCIARWPRGIVRPDRTVDKLISIMDFAPTFTELAGAESIPDQFGRSLMPWLKDDPPLEWRNAVFSQCNGVEVYYTQRMVRTERYKLVYHPTDIDELYDLQLDPGEMRNLAEDPDYQEIKQHLLKAMWREAADARDIIFNPYPTIATADVGPGAALTSKPSFIH